jgi:hypothetical protein
MQRTNAPTIIVVLIAICLAGGLVYYAVDKGESTTEETGSVKKYEAVTGVAEPVSFELAAVPDGPKLDLDAVVKSADGDEVKLADIVYDRAVILYLDTDLGDRRLRAITRDLKRLVQGGEELKFTLIVLFPRGTSSSNASDFMRKRQLRAPPYIDVDGEFVEANGWATRTAALVDGAGTIMLKFEPCHDWDERFGVIPPLTDDVLFWAWDIPEKAPRIDQAAKDASIPLVRAALSADFGGDAVPEGLRALAADPALAGAPEHALYVSLFRPGETKRLRGMADSGSLGERLAVATGRALDGAHDRDEWVSAAAEIRFTVDVLGPDFAVPGRELRSFWYFVEPGVDGVRVVNGDKEGVVLPGEVITQGILSPRVTKRNEKLPRLLSEACRRGGLGGQAWEKADTDLRRFRTTSWGEVVPGAGSTDLYRANVLIGDQSPEDILEVIQLGGRWLLNTVKEDGTFDYQYYPNTDEGSRDYSWVRHAGSVYGLFEMAELAHREPYLNEDFDDYMEAGATSIGGVFAHLDKIPGDDSGTRHCLMDGRKCESGSAALTLMTYLSRPPREHIGNPAHIEAIYRDDDEEIMEGLALAITDMIDGDGKVFRTWAESQEKENVSKEPLYYPGECMLALTRFYMHTEDERWLDAAKSIAGNQMAIYRKNRWSNPDHWVMQALYLLFHTTGDAEYADVAMQMGTHHASEQFSGPHVEPFPDYRGSYRRSNDVPRTTRAGSRTEAMMGVVRTAWEAGEDARIYEDAVLEATRHMSEQIFKPGTSFWMANPDRAVGALRMGIVDNHCRIDNNQHALVGIAGALEVARKREAAHKD